MASTAAAAMAVWRIFSLFEHGTAPEQHHMSDPYGTAIWRTNFMPRSGRMAAMQRRT
jgi:hypothetical protein